MSEIKTNNIKPNYYYINEETKRNFGIPLQIIP